jgi:hypothetical protein
MSGGSFNYLCDRYDAAGLLDGMRDLEAMSDRLAELGYANDAASETRELLLNLRVMEMRCEVAIKRLRDVWRAVEWFDSCDWGEGSIGEALSTYRAPIERREHPRPAPPGTPDATDIPPSPTGPHQFEGRLDRGCERCGRRDRDPIHAAPSDPEGA